MNAKIRRMRQRERMERLGVFVVDSMGLLAIVGVCLVVYHL